MEFLSGEKISQKRAANYVKRSERTYPCADALLPIVFFFFAVESINIATSIAISVQLL
jgi:hypothetical protein